MPHAFLQASSARTPASLKRIVHRFVFSATRSHVNIEQEHTAVDGYIRVSFLGGLAFNSS